MPVEPVGPVPAGAIHNEEASYFLSKHFDDNSIENTYKNLPYRSAER